MSREVFLVEAVRSPMGKLAGALSSVRPDDLSAHVMRELLRRAGIDSSEVQEVFWGCANQAGEDNRNVARMAALIAGFPYEVPACTVNRLCGSGLEAVNLGAKTIFSGELDLVLAGGAESMSRAPWVFPKSSQAFAYGNVTAYDTALGWRFPNPKLEARFPLYSMGETAENIAEKHRISRQEQDLYALRSHQRAVEASKTTAKEEIVPIPVKAGEVGKDEPPRADTSLEKLSALAPVFRTGGTVTAGNSSPLTDGAAAVLLAEKEKAKELGLKPLARWLGSAVSGVDPSYMGLGPVPAVQKLLSRLKISLDQVDLIEINEAFSVQVLACARELNIPEEKLNVRGGAIALGHPLGCSGARLLTTLAHEMRRRKARLGLAALCIGVGQGIAALFERTE